MSKFSLDFNTLSNTISKKVYKLSDVADRIEKIAFDIVRFRDGDDRANLWQIQSADDGDYIVSMYDNETSEQKKSESSWEVVANKSAGELSFFYNDDFVVKVSAAQFGIENDNLDNFSKHLNSRLSDNKKLASMLVKKASKEVREALVKKYPNISE